MRIPVIGRHTAPLSTAVPAAAQPRAGLGSDSHVGPDTGRHHSWGWRATSGTLVLRHAKPLQPSRTHQTESTPFKGNEHCTARRPGDFDGSAAQRRVGGGCHAR